MRSIRFGSSPSAVLLLLAALAACDDGPTVVPEPVPVQATFSQLETGHGAICGIAQEGRLFCFGNEIPGASSHRAYPFERMYDSIRFATIEIGQPNIGPGMWCGTDLDGVGYCWNSTGFNLGTGSDSRDGFVQPQRIAGNLRFRSISPSWIHACGITQDGAAYCWGARQGNGVFGALAYQPYTPESTPVRVGEGLAFRSISAGLTHTCALTTEGAAYCWGSNTAQKLGVTETAETCSYSQRETRYYRCSKDPVAVQGGLRFDTIVSGNDHNCGLTAGGEAYCWGSNGSGQLGGGAAFSASSSSVPVRVAGGHTFTTLTARSNATCGLTPEGRPLCWGKPHAWEEPTNVPEELAGGLRLKKISLDDWFPCGVALDDEVYCYHPNPGLEPRPWFTE